MGTKEDARGEEASNTEQGVLNDQWLRGNSRRLQQD